MSGASFDAKWLSLREPVDHASVAAAPLACVASLAAAAAAAGRRLQVLDLGAGTGSHLRQLAPRLGVAQDWMLADRDGELLRTCAHTLHEWRRRHPDIAVDLAEIDIDHGFDRLPIAGSDLVTASALLDLVSARWLARLVDAMAAARAAGYFRLSVSGWISFEPALPGDAAVIAAFNADQRADKGFGAALGPGAGPALANLLHVHGYAVHMASANWRLGSEHAPLAARLLRGYAEVAIGAGVARAEVHRWLDARLELAGRDPRARVLVGHWDVAGLPPWTRVGEVEVPDQVVAGAQQPRPDPASE